MAGNAILRQIAEPISQEEFNTPELIELTTALLDMMKSTGGVGLAAPQIGISKRIIALGVSDHARNKRDITIPNQIIINPEFTPIDDTLEEDYEGCLSVGELVAKVPRYKKINYHGFDVYGNLIEDTVVDLHARIIQHEVDHLDGILFLEKVADEKSFIVYEELKKLRQKAS